MYIRRLLYPKVSNMNRLPAEISEKIFDYILNANPFEIFRLRAVCKTWKYSIDKYVSRCSVWKKACRRNIPAYCLNCILGEKYPLCVWPWQTRYWGNSLSSKIPEEVYCTWKNLPTFREKPKIQSPEVPLIKNEIIWFFVIYQKFMAVVLKSIRRENKTYKTHIYNLANNISKPMRKYAFFCTDINFYATDDQILVIFEGQHPDSHRLDQEDRTYYSNFLENNEIIPLNLERHELKNYYILDNECFTVCERSITHRIWNSGSFENSAEITLPVNNDQNKFISNMHINNGDLQVLVLSSQSREALWIYTFRITRHKGKLQFTPRETDFCQEMYFRDPEEAMSATRRFYIPFGGITYLKIESSSFIVESVMDFPHNLISTKESIFKDWFERTLEQECTCMASHANYIATGTNEGNVFIFKWTSVDEIIGCIEGGVQPEYATLPLKRIGNKPIEHIEVTHLGLSLQIYIQTKNKIFIVSYK